MTFRRVFSIFSIVLAGLVGYAAADEPLSVKVELRHGTYGPVRRPVVFAGERLSFCLNLSGLAHNEKKEFKFSAKSEMRDEAGELQFEVPVKEFGHPSQLGSSRLSVPLSYGVALDQPEGTLSAIFYVTDLITGKSIKEVVTIEVKKATGAYPVMVEYLATTSQGSLPGSGRFTTGEGISLQYWLVDIAKAKYVKSKLEVFRNGVDDAVSTQEISAEISAAYRKLNALQGGFSLAASEPFAGKVRLTVTDEAGNSNAVEMPLEVVGPLELVDAALVAEKPSKSDENTKKE